MWYLIGILISLVVIICLPLFRFRSYWERALKYPKAQQNDALDMLGSHIILSFCEWKPITFEEYLQHVITCPTTTDMGDIFLLIMVIITLVSLWIFCAPVAIIILLIVKSIHFIQTSVEKKIEKNFQDK